jgi:hypothetical protein
MGILDLFRRERSANWREVPETRSAMASGFTAQILTARESYISGATNLGELTATVQACVSLWEGAFATADVTGTDLLDRRTMALVARSVALRGESVLLLDGGELVPCSDWDLSTRNGKPRAYRVSISEAGGGRVTTALAAEVLHIRTASDPVSPWAGQSPLRRSAISANLLHELEAALRDVFRDAPLGSQIIPLPDSSPADMAEMRAAFKGRRGASLIVEGVAQATAAGMNPQIDKRPDSVSPDLSRSMTSETLQAARAAISQAYGVLPALHNHAATGPVIREAQRHLAQWTLEPLAKLVAEEATAKLGGVVTIDVVRPLQAYDAGGKARAFAGIVQAMTQAKEAGIDTAPILQSLDNA